MIISASRRTDVPCYYSEWFLNRLKEGWLYVRNPMNPHQISRIDLSPEVVISFVDMYAKTRKNMKDFAICEPGPERLETFASELARIAGKNHMKIASCAEEIDLSSCGIAHNCCIDRQLIEKLTDCKLLVQKDRNQRKECGCVESVEIGAYDPLSPLLCGKIMDGDMITERKMRSLKAEQISIFELMGEELISF